MLRDIFGVNESRAHVFFRRALDFFIRVFNQSARSCARPHFEPLEPAWQIEIAFADGTARKQLGNPRPWNMYRGFSVGPYVLLSLLMALESWLLNYAIVDTEHNSQDGKPLIERRAIDEITADAANAVWRAFWGPGGIALDAYGRLNVEEWYGADANEHILTILSGDSREGIVGQ